MKTIKTSLLCITILLLCLFQASCKKELNGEVTDDPELVSTLKTNSSDTLLFDGSKYFLTTYLSRDFFPSALSFNKKHLLTAYINIVNADSSEVSIQLDADVLFVINKTQIWHSKLSNDDSWAPLFTYKKFSLNGPEWETGTNVDVVVEIHNKKTDERFFLIAREQPIIGTE